MIIENIQLNAMRVADEAIDLIRDNNIPFNDMMIRVERLWVEEVIRLFVTNEVHGITFDDILFIIQNASAMIVDELYLQNEETFGRIRDILMEKGYEEHEINACILKSLYLIVNCKNNDVLITDIFFGNRIYNEFDPINFDFVNILAEMAYENNSFGFLSRLKDTYVAAFNEYFMGNVYLTHEEINRLNSIFRNTNPALIDINIFDFSIRYNLPLFFLAKQKFNFEEACTNNNFGEISYFLKNCNLLLFLMNKKFLKEIVRKSPKAVVDYIQSNKFTAFNQAFNRFLNCQNEADRERFSDELRLFMQDPYLIARYYLEMSTLLRKTALFGELKHNKIEYLFNEFSKNNNVDSLNNLIRVHNLGNNERMEQVAKRVFHRNFCNMANDTIDCFFDNFGPSIAQYVLSSRKIIKSLLDEGNYELLEFLLSKIKEDYILNGKPAREYAKYIIAKTALLFSENLEDHTDFLERIGIDRERLGEIVRRMLQKRYIAPRNDAKSLEDIKETAKELSNLGFWKFENKPTRNGVRGLYF